MPGRETCFYYILQVLTEKLGAPDKSTANKLTEQRRSNPDSHPSPVCDHYNAKLQHLALLEFDRDRKSMSVICRQTPFTRHTGGVQPAVLWMGLAQGDLLVDDTERRRRSIPC